MKLFITGPSGYVGAEVARLLLSQGHTVGKLCFCYLRKIAFIFRSLNYIVHLCVSYETVVLSNMPPVKCSVITSGLRLFVVSIFLVVLLVADCI